ncbi:hypothetical protein NUSPORA_00035 [Nucleospora cyclopteri]
MFFSVFSEFLVINGENNKSNKITKLNEEENEIFLPFFESVIKKKQKTFKKHSKTQIKTK